MFVVQTPTVACNVAQTAAELEAALLAAGYTPGVPAHIRPETVSIDKRIAHRCRCPHCRRGLEYRPFGRAFDRRYRVLAVCSLCSFAEER